jgi:sec-independent protein translocase protein TatA
MMFTTTLGPLAFALGGPYDIAIIGGVVLLLFGGAKISGIGRAMGTSIREFKKATQDEPEEATPEVTVTPPK